MRDSTNICLFVKSTDYIFEDGQDNDYILHYKRNGEQKKG